MLYCEIQNPESSYWKHLSQIKSTQNQMHTDKALSDIIHFNSPIPEIKPSQIQFTEYQDFPI